MVVVHSLVAKRRCCVVWRSCVVLLLALLDAKSHFIMIGFTLFVDLLLTFSFFCVDTVSMLCVDQCTKLKTSKADLQTNQDVLCGVAGTALGGSDSAVRCV